MNEIKKEYGWITAITPEEIKALGNPMLGDERFFNAGWMAVSRLFLDGYWQNGNPVRRPIDPEDGFELVPECEARHFACQPREGIEHWSNGKWTISKEPFWNEHLKITFRRRKAKSEPAMEEGWELVPKGEVEAAHGDFHPHWQFMRKGCWQSSSSVDRYTTYRRPKSKPVEQYGWLKAGCGAEMPLSGIFHAKLQDGHLVNVELNTKTNLFFIASSGMPLPSPIAYWFRMPPAPEVEKVDPLEEHVARFYKSSLGTGHQIAAFKSGWHACCAHYHVGDQSKGAK